MSPRVVRLLDSPINIPGYAGHTHFWERLTRRRFLTTATGALGLALGSSAGMTKLVDAQVSSVLPKPIPGGTRFLGPGTELFHVFGLGPGAEPSTITDFDGFVGGANVTGQVKQIDVKTGAITLRFFDNDMRFMQGHYVGVDGEQHNGTFGFF